MVTRKEAYNVLTKVYDGPSPRILEAWRNKLDIPGYESTIDDLLLNDAIVFFATKYLLKVEDILGLDVDKEEENFFENNTINEVKKYYSDINLKTYKEKNIKFTDYQEAGIEFLNEKRGESSLIVMPTGYGKTILAFNEMLEVYKLGKKIVFTAPTNKLVKQQEEEFIEYLNSIGRKDLQCKILLDFNDSSTKNFNEEKNFIFMTPHKMDKLIENGILDNSYFYVIDEVHEGTKKEKEEYKYPTFKNLSNLDNTNILALSATPSNMKVLREKLGINNVFNGADRKYFIPKNRLKTIVEKDDNYLDLENTLIGYIFHYTNSLLNFIEKLKREKTIYDKDFYLFLDKEFNGEKLLNSNYLDADKIKYCEEFLDKDHEKNTYFYSSLWNLKYFLDIKKSLQQDSYKQTFANVLLKIQSNAKNISKHIITINNLQNKINKTSDQSKIYKLKHKQREKQGYLNYLKNKRDFLVNFNEVLKQNHNFGSYSPKTKKMFDIILKNKKVGKKTLVYVENKKMIDEFVTICYEKMGLIAGYMKGGVKNKSSKFIESYIKEMILGDKMDVIFTTSTAKLGLNYDFDNLIFYHQPKNFEDLLQFEGRIGRFSKKANIWSLAMENSQESHKMYRNIREAELYMDKSFLSADKFLSGKDFGDITSIYSKKDIISKKTELSVQQLLDLNVENHKFVNARFKLYEKIGIFENNNGNFYACLYVFDSSSKRGLLINVFASNKYRKKESKINELNNFINSLDLNSVYQFAGKAYKIGEGYDKVLNINLSQETGSFINKVLEKDYIKEEYDFEKTDFGSNYKNVYPNLYNYHLKQINYLETSLFD